MAVSRHYYLIRNILYSNTISYVSEDYSCMYVNNTHS